MALPILPILGYIAKLALAAGKATLVIAKGVAVASAKTIRATYTFLKAHPELAKFIADGVITSFVVDEIKTQAAGRGVPTDQVEAYLEFLRGQNNLTNLQNVTANQITLKAGTPSGGLQRAGNHPKFWASEGDKINALKQVYSIKESDNLLNFMVNKHYCLVMPKWGFDSVLFRAPLRSAIEAYYRQILKFSPEYTVTDRTLEENENAVKAIMMNSVSIHALIKQIKRSQDAHHLIIQDSQEFGKKVRPFYRKFAGNNTPVGDGLPVVEGYKPISTEAITPNDYALIRMDASPETIPDTDWEDAIASMTISNATWSRMVSEASSVIYESKQMQEYIDWILDGGFINSEENGSASELLTFYYDCPIYYLNIAEDGSYITVNHPFLENGLWKPTTVDDFKAILNYTVQTQQQLLSNYPAVPLILSVMGLKLQLPKDRDGFVKSLQWETPKTLINDYVQPLWQYTRRDPLANSYRIHRLSNDDRIALENATIVAASHGLLVNDIDETDNTLVTQRTVKIYRTYSSALTSENDALNMCFDVVKLRQYLSTYSPNDETDLAYFRQELGKILDKYENRAVAIPRSNDSFLLEPHIDAKKKQIEYNSGSYDLGKVRSHIKWGGAYYLEFKGVTVTDANLKVKIDAGIDMDIPVKAIINDESGFNSLRPRFYRFTSDNTQREAEARAHNSLYPHPLNRTVAAPFWYELVTVDRSAETTIMDLSKGILCTETGIVSDEDTQFLILRTGESKVDCRNLGYYHLFLGEQAFAKMAIIGNAITEYYQTIS